MTLLRGTIFALLVVVAITLQVAVFHYVAIDGVVPNLALLVVVAAALARGPQFGVIIGFCAGLLLDLTPPADHLAGRWALALVVVGYLAGRVRSESRRSTMATLLTVAACSFVGTSIFALSGLVWGDGALPADEMLIVIGIAVVWDVVMTPLVLPASSWLFRKLRPPRLAY